jgi:hypothetical protein
MKRRRGHTLRRRYGHAKGGSMRGLAHWSTFADGGYELVFEGRKYSIHPRHALEHGNRRSGGWSLSVSPGTRGLHSSIDRLGDESGHTGSFGFQTPASAAVAARKFAARAGAEPHGIMAGQAASAAKIEAIADAPDFWERVDLLRESATAEGDSDLARICRVALLEKRRSSPDARKCARALWEAGGMR